MLKNKKGITLIALVVTIVVLLILAGISISLIVDKNGIIQKSKDARRIASESAKNELDNMNRLIEEMNEVAPEWSGKTTKLPEFKNNETTNKFDWYIYNEPQMKFFANFVNQTLTAQDEKLMSDKNVTAENIAITEQTTIYLMNDLDLGARFDENGKLTLGVEWVPVGKTKTLVGTFEGNNHYIKGVYVNSDTKFCGIFGNTNTIQNLTVKNSYIEGNICIGGIAGVVRGGKVENCHNMNTTVVLKEGGRSAAGIAGQMNQKNGQSNSIVRLCYNSGNISGGPVLGGIVAFFCGQSQQGTVENCYSKGTITAPENNGGAIIGKKNQADGNATFNNLYYLSTIGLYAVNNNQSYESDTVKAVDDDIKTYEEFLEWIKTK